MREILNKGIYTIRFLNMDSIKHLSLDLALNQI